MKLKTGIILLVSFLLVHTVSAQTREVEDLMNSLENTGGKERIDLLISICKKICTMDPEKGIAYGREALHLADSLNIPSKKSKIYNTIGLNYWATNDMNIARTYYDSALKNARIFNDTLQIAIYYNRMGLIYESLGIFDSSLIVFEKELTLYKLTKNDKRAGIALENIGTINLKRGKFRTALTYLTEAITLLEKVKEEKELIYIYLKLGFIYSELEDFAIAEKWFQKGIDQALAMNDLQKAGMGLNAVGILYKSQHKFDSALVKYREALETVKPLNDKNLTMSIYDNMGNVYSSRGNFQQALNYHKKSCDLASQMNLPMPIAINQVNMGEDYYGLRDYASARTCYEKALPIFLTSKSYTYLITTYNALIKVNTSLRNYEQAVGYYELYTDLKDSLNKTELNTALDSLKIKFNTEQTDRENLLLKKETEIKTKTISLQRVVMISSFLFLVLLLTLAIAIIRSRKKIKKANELLEVKNLDISAKAEELKQINHRLLELSRFKDSMNSFLVHDLKNPLNAIINIDEKLNSKRQVESIKQSGSLMLNIILNLLDISKYEDKTMKISPEKTSLTHLINKAYSHVHYLADQKSMHLKIHYPTDFIIEADPAITERIFVNLFTNAIKFSSNGDSVEIFAEYINQSHLKIIVKDHGVGINAEFLPHVFEKFTQSQVRQSGFTPSTGIGLAFCKMAVEAHTGEIGVTSVFGQGASFWFTLPLAEMQNDLTVTPMEIVAQGRKTAGWSFTTEEIRLLTPYCDRLKEISIYQISDVKDIINSIDYPESGTVTGWKSALLTALSDCNALRYSELINIISDAKL